MRKQGVLQFLAGGAALALLGRSPAACRAALADQQRRPLRAPAAPSRASPILRSARRHSSSKPGKSCTHPRCLNCHPAGDRPAAGRPVIPISRWVQRGADGHGLAAMRCTTCHQAANYDAGRHARPSGVASGAALDGVAGQVARRDLRAAEGSGAQRRATSEEIVEHMAHDSLVGWGWTPGVGREPAPGTQAAFGALIKAWADTGAVCPGR